MKIIGKLLMLKMEFIHCRNKKSEVSKMRMLETVEGLLVEINQRLIEVELQADAMRFDNKSGLRSSSYYHFDSNGKKLPSKWDSFDVDSEMAKLDEEEGKGDKGGSVHVGKVVSKVAGLEHDIEAILAFLDSVRGNESVKCARKALIVRIDAEYLSRVDALKQRCSQN